MNRPSHELMLALAFTWAIMSCGSNSPEATYDSAIIDSSVDNFLDGAANSDFTVAVCGNGTIEIGETCDKAITSGNFGACPIDCDDQAVCTKDTVVGSECNKTCKNEEILTCDKMLSDKCCPVGCNTATDIDCSPWCGNGALDLNETCDKAIADGQIGACPKNCDDNFACTEDKLTGAECTVACSHTVNNLCNNQIRDKCCPSNCVASNDLDCLDLCGNGQLDGNENCDPKIPEGVKGSCINFCDDGNGCTTDLQMGNINYCQAACRHTTITVCSTNYDGCCPNFICAKASDPDCNI